MKRAASLAGAGSSLILVWLLAAPWRIDTARERRQTLERTPEVSEGKDRYFVVFAARGGALSTSGTTAGHAYVSWGREVYSATPPVSVQECYGVFADGWAEGHNANDVLRGTLPVRMSDGDCWRSDNTQFLIVHVTQPDYQRSFEVYRRWASRTTASDVSYRLLLRDCVTFIAEVAAALDLKRPWRGLHTPATFVAAMIESNP